MAERVTARLMGGPLDGYEIPVLETMTMEGRRAHFPTPDTPTAFTYTNYVFLSVDPSGVRVLQFRLGRIT